ncbi:hypothetical protein MGU_08855 [Metarhizium guizhouense ARSEF 977]|uniref:PiggyBac transposable element-derived protein domain-containing protein n=1 Tax=Metarhizium guizhouense (strain ARSEF 977) TaxID=1276136 RepID=A0A0B4GMQ8_METGA|nr:hypothetical protein MGU_08855 [Metarhizium guizhouense ARSEF 977]
MSEPNSSSANVAFLLNSSQPEDLDDAVTLEQNSDCAKAAGGIQTAVFLVEREPNRDVNGRDWSQDSESDDDDDLYLPHFSPFELIQSNNKPTSRGTLSGSLSLPFVPQNDKKRTYQRRKPHDPTTYAELMIFLAILLYMSIHRERDIRAYWAHREDLPAHPIGQWMSRDRFRWLYRNFCVWDPTNPPTSIWARTAEWSEFIVQKSLSLWRPGFYVAVDESMVRFQGRCFDKTMMKTKPIPVGLKIFVIAEKGFVLGFAPYTRNGIQMPPLRYMPEEDGTVLSETRAVVAHLALSILPYLPSSSASNSFRLHVFGDNLFTSVELAQYLFRRKILYTGTARTGGYGGLDSRFSTLKAHDDLKKDFPWGTVFTSQASRKVVVNRKPQLDKQRKPVLQPDDVNQIAWKDGQTVMFLTSAYTGLEEPITTKRKRPSAGSTHARTSRAPFGDDGEAELPVPLVAAAYNKKMNGVDIADQFRADTAHSRRIRRGAAQTLMYDFNLGTTVTNAFLIFRELAKVADDAKKVSQSDFRQILYRQITKKFGQDAVPKWSTKDPRRPF